MSPAPGTRPKTYSFAMIARDVPVAIVLRRGPRRYTQLLRWDLRNDTIEPGQWLHGTLEHRGCAVSPDGELFVYAARKGARAFTAISRPPYFTALAYWEQRLPWSGGGFFPSRDAVVLGVTHPPDDGSLPRGLTVSDVWSYFAWRGNRRSSVTFGDAVLAAPEAHHGWARSDRGWTRQHPTRPGLGLEADAPPGSTISCRLVDERSGAHELGALDWVDWDPEGESLLFGRAGGLHRQAVPARIDGAWTAAVQVADLTPHAFERIVAPELARRWPRRLQR